MKPLRGLQEAVVGRETWPALLEDATREVFEIMLGAQLAAAGAVDLSNSEFTSMIGLAGQLTGVFMVRCDGRCAARITSRMLAIPEDQTGEQVWDALGELCNMVAGNFKNKLAGISEHCMLSVPTVIHGGDYRFRSMADGESMQISLLVEGSPITIDLNLA